MPRRPITEAAKTRKKILASALTLFADKGYAKTTFVDIAAKLNMTKGAVYWHFESKEALLIALIEEMVERFELSMSGVIKEDELSYLSVADELIRNAKIIAGESSLRKFITLLRTQIRWGDASMKKVREDLLTNHKFSPRCAFRKALESDVASRRVSPDIDIAQIINISLSMWDGLIQNEIESILDSDLEATLKTGFNAIWQSIKI